MKLRLILSALLFAFVAGPLVHADPKQPPTALEKQMKVINKAYKQLKAQAGDATKNAASATLVQQMEAAVTAAGKLIPAKAADLSADKQAAFNADYKAQMQKFEATLEKLAAAFKAGDNATATKLVADLGAQEKAGHKEFRKPQN